MSWLLDTSVLVGTIHYGAPRHDPSIRAISLLLGRSEELVIVPQALVEFWAVATRPATANGLGLSTEDARKEIGQIKLNFAL